MTMDPELLELMPDEIQVWRYLGLDDVGNELFAAVPETVPANITINFSASAVPDHDGRLPDDSPITGEIYVPDGTVRPHDKIKFLGMTREVGDVTTYRDAPEVGEYLQQISYRDAYPSN